MELYYFHLKEKHWKRFCLKCRRLCEYTNTHIKHVLFNNQVVNTYAEPDCEEKLHNATCSSEIWWSYFIEFFQKIFAENLSGSVFFFKQRSELLDWMQVNFSIQGRHFWLQCSIELFCLSPSCCRPLIFQKSFFRGSWNPQGWHKWQVGGFSRKRKLTKKYASLSKSKQMILAPVHCTAK